MPVPYQIKIIYNYSIMRCDIITLFPEILVDYFTTSILGRAQENKIIKIVAHDLRKFGKGKRRNVDDTPYGGGPGMILGIEPLYECLRSVKRVKKSKVILLDPAGKQFDQKMAMKFSKQDQLIFVCGRYEGFDARITKFVDEKVSIGPFVLAGGELAAAAIIEATARLLPKVLGSPDSITYETFSGKNADVVEYPQYTRPEVFQKQRVPKILLSGDHEKIRIWREKKQK